MVCVRARLSPGFSWHLHPRTILHHPAPPSLASTHHSQEDFYDELIQERLAGKRLHTCLAIAGDGHGDEEFSAGTSATRGEIVSCMVGSFVPFSRLSRHMRSMLLPDPSQYKHMFYIMTLGTTTDHRKVGLGSAMVEWVESLVKRDPTCGGVYLHVITYNEAAIRFYERLGFYFVEEVPDYYDIDGRKYSSYLYAKYLNGNRGHRDLFRALSRVFLAFLRQFRWWLGGVGGGVAGGGGGRRSFQSFQKQEL